MIRVCKDFIYFIRKSFQCDKRYFICFFLTVFLKSISPFALIVFPKYILNEIFGACRLEYVVSLIVAMGFANITINAAINFVEPKLSNRIQHLRKGLSQDLSQHILQMDYAYMEDSDVIDTKQKAIEFIYGGQGIDSFTFTAQAVIISIVQSLGYSYLLFSVNPLLIILIMILSLGNAYLQGKNEKYSYDAEMEVVRPNRRGSYLDFLCSDFGYVKEIKLFNIQNWVLEKKDYYNQIKMKAFDKVCHKFIVFGIVSTVSNTLLNMLVYFYLVWQLTFGRIPIGDFTLYLSTITNFSGTLSGLFSAVVKLMQVDRYLSNYIIFREMKNQINNREFVKKHISVKKMVTLEFQHVSFRYPKQESMTLKDINVTIHEGERLSIVGKNGAGKTTFIKLILRLYDPTEGRILLNGIDIRQIDYAEYLRLFSAVFQDFKIFSFTVKENILLQESKKQQSDEECMELLRKIGLDKKIELLPLGVETGIGKQYYDDGIELSGGEAQKLAIARALFKNAPVVILDEPTSALDPLSEYEIYKNFDGLVENKTSIYISHRLSSTRFSDRILLFEQGKIVESGNHDQLMALDGLYKVMFEKQAQFYMEMED